MGIQQNLLIVIVNYRTSGLAVGCLESLEPELAAMLPSCRTLVVIVDNDSGDRSAETIADAVCKRGWAAWAEVLPLARNVGFAGGNNAGIRHATRGGDWPDFVLLLNPDTVVRPGAVKALVEFLAARPDVGIVGGCLEDAQGRLESAARRIPSPLGELDAAARIRLVAWLVSRHVVPMAVRPDPHECDWISGACMLVRRPVFDSIGLLDDGYFLYYEEVDFCTRARRAGWKCWYVPSSRVLHLEGSSTGIQQGRRRRTPFWYQARRRFFTTHYGTAGLIASDVLWAIGRFVHLARKMIPVGSRQPARDPLYFARDLLWGDLRWLLGVPRARRRRAMPSPTTVRI